MEKNETMNVVENIENSDASEQVNEKRKRPILVWLIFIFMILGSGFTTLSIISVSTGMIPLEGEMKTYFEQLSTLDYLLTVTMGILNVIGAVYLFRLKTLSCYLLSIALIINICTTVWHIISKSWLDVMAAQSGGLFGMFLGMGIAFLIVIYSFRLKSKKILI